MTGLGREDRTTVAIFVVSMTALVCAAIALAPSLGWPVEAGGALLSFGPFFWSRPLAQWALRRKK